MNLSIALKMGVLGGTIALMLGCEGNQEPAIKMEVSSKAAVAQRAEMDPVVDNSVDNSIVDNSADKVVANVDASAITERQLRYAIKKTLGSSVTARFDQRIERKILDSLVYSRAMAIAYEKDMDEKERTDIDLVVNAYREEVLVKRYLKSTIEPETVTSKMVKDYYETHLEEFGASVIKEYELLRTVDVLDEKKRPQIIAEFEQAKTTQDWKKQAEKMALSDTKVEYQQSANDPKVLLKELQQLVEQTEVGDTSAIGFFEGKLAIVRVVGQKQLAAKPLNEVSKRIREKLAPLQLKKAVKKASATALAAVTVQYAQ